MIHLNQHDSSHCMIHKWWPGWISSRGAHTKTHNHLPDQTCVYVKWHAVLQLRRSGNELAIITLIIVLLGNCVIRWILRRWAYSVCLPGLLMVLFSDEETWYFLSSGSRGSSLSAGDGDVMKIYCRQHSCRSVFKGCGTSRRVLPRVLPHVVLIINSVKFPGSHIDGSPDWTPSVWDSTRPWDKEHCWWFPLCQLLSLPLCIAETG